MNGLYDFYHLNFISAVSRQKLEDLALAALEANVVMNIHKVLIIILSDNCTILESENEIFNCYFQVFDQYLNFISLEDDLFILRNQDTESISYFGELNFIILNLRTEENMFTSSKDVPYVIDSKKTALINN